MRSLTGLLWVGGAFQTYAAASEALIYTFPETSRGQSRTPTISPNDARLLFAQRLGLSEYHSLGDVGQETLELLSLHGGQQKSIFDDAPKDSPKRLLLFIDGVEHPEDMLDAEISAPTLKIHDPPPSEENLQLVKTLNEQDNHRTGELQHTVEGWITKITDFLGSYNDRHENRECAVYLSLSELKGESDSNKMQGLKSAIKEVAHASKHLTSTIVLMPPSNPNKKRTTNPYGLSSLPPTSHLSRRSQPQTEAPLSAPPLPNPASSSSSHPSPPELLASATETTPVRGILPICHSSLKLAISTTHNCSHHGTPYLKYQTKSSDDSSKMLDCWACNCGTTVTTDEDGKKKTVFWSGPACQKKDVSVPFWLLAGLGVGLAATVSWGVGLMYSIGDEALPSVIGAGVAGPRAQK